MTAKSIRPSVSIIVPFWRELVYLDSLVSVLRKWVHPGIEIVWIDDSGVGIGSSLMETTRTGEIILCNLSNRGIGYSRNIGMAVATGEYFLFLDVDDSLDFGELSRILGIIENSELEMVRFHSKPYGEEGQERFVELTMPEILKFAPAPVMNMIWSRQFTPSACMYFFKASFLRENNLEFDEQACFEDYMFTFTALLSASMYRDSLVNVHLRRVNAESRTQSMSNVQKSRCYREIALWATRQLIRVRNWRKKIAFISIAGRATFFAIKNQFRSNLRYSA